MKKEEALDKIDYLKTLVDKTSITVFESYPFLILWGLLWIVGYTATIWLPDEMWIGIGIVGGIVSMLIGRYWPWNEKSDLRLLLKVFFQSLVVVAVFFLYPLLLESPVMKTGAESMFYPIMVGVIYILYGIMIGKEMVILGFALVVTAIMGIFLTGAYQNIWYAVVCSGILLWTGFDFRRKVKLNGNKS